MAYTSYEQLNVFDDSILSELNERRKSTNLVQTRTPFLRYTTTVDFGGKTSPNLTNSIKYLGGNYGDVTFPDYNGCKFFTLGMHGWDNKNYSDMYNSQGNNGLIVGTTYKDGKQTLVKTFNKNTISPNSYPPPGIESATVERLRNGNVLKMTINVVCYTQAQLDMLDVLAFAPGMDCVLEWGNIISTPSGTKSLSKILDFSKTDTIETLKTLKTKNYRDKFIKEWCEPNNFNYDFALAQIANVKTTLENNKYKVTVIAYGPADNLMYVSAYATTVKPEINKTTSSTIRDYFSPNAGFLNELETADTNPLLKDGSVVKFDEKVDEAKKILDPNTAIQVGQTNDYGQERTFYIRFDKFINYFLNTQLAGIANQGSRTQITKFVSDINVTTDGTTNIPLGWNKFLKSTDPSILLIANSKATLGQSATQTQEMVENIINTPGEQFNKNITTLTKKGFIIPTDATSKLGDVFPIPAECDENSGIMLPDKGIWLNSKGLQEVFMGAKTVFEGVETLLNKLNAATEGYWNLKLMFDEDDFSLRIVDDNVKGITKKEQGIHTFNKLLTSTADGTNTLGPEVLSIKVDTDYPKMLYAQLAISGLGNYSSQPDTRDLYHSQYSDKGLSNRLNSLLNEKNMQPRLQETLSPDIKRDIGRSTFDLLNNAIEPFKNALNNEVGNLGAVFGGSLQMSSESGNSPANPDTAVENIPKEILEVLNNLVSTKELMSLIDARIYANIINSASLLPEQLKAIIAFIKKRDQVLIDYYKNKEVQNFRDSVFGLFENSKLSISDKNQPFVDGAWSAIGKNRRVVGDKFTGLTDQSRKVITLIEKSQTDLKNLFN